MRSKVNSISTPPLISVVIPLYNKADTIERTLRSVACQDSNDFEVIVVDDGSSDEGADVAARFIGCQNLKVVRQINAGVSAARNRGVAEANGRYIAFLDADDEWKPGFLSAVQGVLRDYPEARVIGTGYERVSRNFRLSCRTHSRVFICNLFDVWPFFQPINSSSLVIEKQVYKETGGYRENLTFWEDGELWFRLAAKYKFYIVRKPLSRYNCDAQFGATSSKSGLAKSEPHMELLKSWINQGIATRKMRKCYKNTCRAKVSNWRTDFLFWFYKRIRFYLWFSKTVHA